MKQNYKLIIVAFLSLMMHVAYGQQFILYREGFDTPGLTLSLNTGGPGSNTGTNKWIVNSNYTGTPLYANTLPEDSVVSGTINGAPYSSYLHIHDEATRLGGGVSNANYNGTVVSDNFAYTSGGFCTLGLTDVIFTFFNLCEGSPNAYGELYYSIDSGPWTNTGTVYNNQHRWKYETVTNPAWANKPNVRLGFRWRNDAGSPTLNSSWAIDDILAVATYDSLVYPVDMNITSVSPNPVCQLGYLFINYRLSVPLCNGQYRVELSNASGSFSSPTVLNTYTLSGDTLGAIAVQIPGTTPPGACYRIRLTRISPPPTFSSEVSACFTVLDCPNTITPISALVLTDPDTACVRSAIDIKFQSVGVFNPGNQYIAELSDTNGSFAAPARIGVLPSTTTFDPSLGIPPGTVSGLIPNVPAGCGYFLRIRSTNPRDTGSVYGPFCLKHCDITTNSTQDLKFCITDTPSAPVCDSIDLDIHYFDSIARYYPGNMFRLQLRSMMTFAVINDGSFYFRYDTVSRKLVICIPWLDSLATFGIAPGAYYARFIADSSSVPNNINGTIIRVTIGAPQSNPPQILLLDTVGCNVGVMELYVNPFLHPPSDYEWVSTGVNSGFPFIWPYNPLRVDFTGAPINDYTFFVREINYGCYGPYSDPARIYIIATPPVTISGPDQVCLGDTVCFDVPYVVETYYTWTSDSGTTIDASNNQFCVVFKDTGTHWVEVDALNDCGASTNRKTIKVNQLLTLDLGPDRIVCKGDSITIIAANEGISKSITTRFDSIRAVKGTMFDVKANFDATIVNFETNFQTRAPADIEIYYKTGSYVGSENNPADWTLVLNYFGMIPNRARTPSLIPVDVYLNLTGGETYGFYITTSNASNLLVTGGDTTGKLYRADGILNIYQGTRNNYSFGSFAGPYIWNGRINYTTRGGISYAWSTGENTQLIRVAPEVNSIYRVSVYDTSGCSTGGAVNVTVKNKPEIDAGPDTFICADNPYPMNATSNNSEVNWAPTNGLSNATILNPVATIQTPTKYVLSSTDISTNCTAYDTVLLSIRDCEDPIKVPSAFTPNGDNQNDHFTVFAAGMKQYSIKIFNRWGEMVYESEDVSELNDLGKGWDGKYKGKVQELGTYVYFIKGVDSDNISREKKGNLALIK